MVESVTARGTKVSLEADYDYDRGTHVLRFTVGNDPRPFFSVRGMIANYRGIGENILEACRELLNAGFPAPYYAKLVRAIENAEKPF